MAKEIKRAIELPKELREAIAKHLRAISEFQTEMDHMEKCGVECLAYREEFERQRKFLENMKEHYGS